MPEPPIQIASVPLSQPPIGGTVGQPSPAVVDLKALARAVLGRNTASRGCTANPQRDIPRRSKASIPDARPNIVRADAGPSCAISQPAMGNGAEASRGAEPILLRDGRRLHRLAAAGIVEDRSGLVKELMQAARGYSAGLWADGGELIVVEAWGHLLPDDLLDQLRQHAGAVIAELRGESHTRCNWQVFNPPER